MTPRIPTIVLGADHLHVGAYGESWARTFDVVGISSRPAARERARAAFPAARWYPAGPDLLDAHGRAELAFVFGRHSEMSASAVAVAEAGIPFVLEKPGGLGEAEVAAVVAAAQRTGTPATVPFVQRLGPLPELFARVGRLHHASFQFVTGGPQRYVDHDNGWLLERRYAGRGVLLNLGVHFVDLFLELTTGTVDAVCGRLGNAAHGLEVEDHAAVLLRTDDGATGVVEASYTFPTLTSRYVHYTAAGADGFVAVGDDGTATTRLRTGETITERVEVDSNRYYGRFADLVAQRFGEGFAGLPTLGDLRRTIHVVDAVYGAQPSRPRETA